jgi:hypothetical protein
MVVTTTVQQTVQLEDWCRVGCGCIVLSTKPIMEPCLPLAARSGRVFLKNIADWFLSLSLINSSPDTSSSFARLSER